MLTLKKFRLLVKITLLKEVMLAFSYSAYRKRELKCACNLLTVW